MHTFSFVIPEGYTAHITSISTTDETSITGTFRCYGKARKYLGDVTLDGVRPVTLPKGIERLVQVSEPNESTPDVQP